MTEDEADYEKMPLINSQKIYQLASEYKFPLVFSFAGLIFLIVAIFLMIKLFHQPSEVIFNTATGSSTPASKIYVDIQGEVFYRGVYQFSEENRVSDALEKAGGLTAQADRNWLAINLNRAAKLKDGGKIYIPKIGETENKTQSSNIKSQNQEDKLLGVTAGLININSASQAELESLAGIGPVTAGKIIIGRPYQSIDELKTKKIVGNAVFDKIRNLIKVE